MYVFFFFSFPPLLFLLLFLLFFFFFCYETQKIWSEWKANHTYTSHTHGGEHLLVRAIKTLKKVNMGKTKWSVRLCVYLSVCVCVSLSLFVASHILKPARRYNYHIWQGGCLGHENASRVKWLPSTQRIHCKLSSSRFSVVDGTRPEQYFTEIDAGLCWFPSFETWTTNGHGSFSHPAPARSGIYFPKASNIPYLFPPSSLYYSLHSIMEILLSR